MLKNYAWATVEALSQTVFQFLGLIILTKFLSPTDYGIWGMMAIFIAIGNLLVDSGLGGAIIKKKAPTSMDYSTLFCFNLVVSIVCYLLLFVFAGVIASFYHVEELALYLRVYGLFIVISALGIIQMTQMLKELRFKEMAIITVVSNVISLAIAVLMAYKGCKVWSLIVQHLTFIVLRVSLQFAVCRFVPKIKFSYQSFKEQFSFGGSVLLSNILASVYSNIVSSIIPKIGTTEQNGYYLQASKIQGVPVSVVTMVTDKVIFPELSRLPENKMVEGARKIVRWLFPVVSLCIFVCILLCRPIVLILLGEKWVPVIDYLKVLFFSGFGVCYLYLARNIFKASGKTSLILKTSITNSVVGLIAIAVSASFGVMGLVYGLVISSIIVAIISAIFLAKHIHYSIINQLIDIKWGLAVIIVSVLSIIII